MMRVIGGFGLAIIGVLMAMFAVTTPFALQSQATDDQAYHVMLRRAAKTVDAYLDANARLPQQLGVTGPYGGAYEIYVTRTAKEAVDCDPAFERKRDDRFVLSFWRGEWSECMAYPSGATTMPLTLGRYLRGWLGVELLISALVGAAALWGALRLLR